MGKSVIGKIGLWALLTGVGLCGAAARAAESPFVSADYAQMRLISAGAAQAAVEIRLAPGWHAYWRMPGDGGLAPQADWARSENVAAVAIKWPVPRRYQDMDMNSFGYEGNFILPLDVTVKDAARDTVLDLALDLMVCEKICVPQKLAARLTVPADDTGAAHKARIAAVPLPHQGDLEDLRIENMVIGPDALVARVYAPRGFDAFDMFVESGDVYVTASPQLEIDRKNPHYAQVRIPAPDGVDNLIDAIGATPVVLTVTDGQKAIERRFEF